ncbi:MAG: preprotein translocase subunit SecE [Erysipelotrichia bacterium]|jgi:preprotein translocase SecE subunit|nr:preprotein translocase subunit SecE [Erysipelotrichia bacterium]
MGVKKYTAEVVKEGKRVRWPKREQLLPTIFVVVIIAAFAAIFLSLEDWAAGSLLQTLKDAFAGWSK